MSDMKQVLSEKIPEALRAKLFAASTEGRCAEEMQEIAAMDGVELALEEVEFIQANIQKKTELSLDELDAVAAAGSYSSSGSS